MRAGERLRLRPGDIVHLAVKVEEDLGDSVRLVLQESADPAHGQGTRWQVRVLAEIRLRWTPLDGFCDGYYAPIVIGYEPRPPTAPLTGG